MADLDDGTKWFEVDANNTQPPPDGWPAGMFPNQVEPTAQAAMGAQKRFYNRVNAHYTSSGAAGVFAVVPDNVVFPASYVQGDRFTFRSHQASIGNDTFNWNTLGALPFYKSTTTGIVKIALNDIISGQMCDVIYDVALNSGGGGFWLMTYPAPITAVGQPYCRVHLSANFGLTAGVDTKMPFDVVDFQTGALWDAVNHRFTPNLAGKYLVTAMAQLNGNAPGTTNQLVEIKKNGANLALSDTLIAGIAGFVQSLFVSDIVVLNGSTDYIEGWVSTGGNTLTLLGGSTLTYMAIHFIGP